MWYLMITIVIAWPSVAYIHGNTISIVLGPAMLSKCLKLDIWQTAETATFLKVLFPTITVIDSRWYRKAYHDGYVNRHG